MYCVDQLNPHLLPDPKKLCIQSPFGSTATAAWGHHFPTKTSLFMAAIEELARQSEAHILDSIASADHSDRTLRQILGLIWNAMLNDKYMQTAMEAMVAARTDPELRQLIADLDAESVISMRSVAESLAFTKESTDRVQNAIELSIYLFRGMVVQRGMHDDEKFKLHLFEAWCDLVEKALEGDRL